MDVITFSAIKGGVGKSSLAILTANYLGAAGNRVLMIDFDIQNSATFYYLEDYEAAEGRNLSAALQNNDLPGNIVPGLFVDVIPASLKLVNLRTIATKTFKRLLPQIQQQYDYVIADTPPTFDNLVLNAIEAADRIVTPVQLTLFDYKSAVFYKEQLELETEKAGNWKVLYNRFTEPRTDNPETETNQYLTLFADTFGDHILNTRIPDTRQVQKAIDTKTAVTTAKAKEKLFSAIAELAGEITGKEYTAEKF
jgi:chromosome partitioning protein